MFLRVAPYSACQLSCKWDPVSIPSTVSFWLSFGFDASLSKGDDFLVVDPVDKQQIHQTKLEKSSLPETTTSGWPKAVFERRETRPPRGAEKRTAIFISRSLPGTNGWKNRRETRQYPNSNNTKEEDEMGVEGVIGCDGKICRQGRGR